MEKLETKVRNKQLSQGQTLKLSIEYCAITNATRELVRLRNLLKDLMFWEIGHMELACDN